MCCVDCACTVMVRVILFSGCRGERKTVLRLVQACVSLSFAPFFLPSCSTLNFSSPRGPDRKPIQEGLVGADLFLICTVTRLDGLCLNVMALRRVVIHAACFRLTGQGNGKSRFGL